MNELTQNMLVLAYYDGATEGFIDKTNDNQIYFFKVVAWDENQDKRLFLAGLVSRVIYQELLDVLAKSHQVPTGSTWTPTWIFENPEMEKRANSLVRIGRNSLNAPAFLALGEDLVGKFQVVHTTPSGFAAAIALAHQNAPGNLADWLARSTCM